MTIEEAVLAISEGAKALGWVVAIPEGDENSSLRYMIIGEEDSVNAITAVLDDN